ncbi:MAG: hypothetical protein PHG89_00755 [Gallionella sp.]|nr:hypothetical protein [Gallionella sp.]
MITLNSDQGLISVENWEDIELRPGFVTNLNPSDHLLDSIIGRYLFKKMIRCGLSNCHTLHAKGYIVTTKEGLSTNIGTVCGKKYFGVDFETLSKRFERDITEKENRNRLFSFSFQIEDIEQTISDLRQKEHGANWVNKKTRQLISANKDCPEVIVRRISAMLKTGTNILSIQREATQEEIETLETMQGRKIQRPYVIEEPIADIASIQALYPENDLKKLLVLDLEEPLKVFKGKDIDLLNFDELRHWAKWVNSVESTLEKAVTAVMLGNALLSRKNLEPFSKILTTRDDIAIFRSYLKELHE